MKRLQKLDRAAATRPCAMCGSVMRNPRQRRFCPRCQRLRQANGSGGVGSPGMTAIEAQRYLDQQVARECAPAWERAQ